MQTSRYARYRAILGTGDNMHIVRLSAIALVAASLAACSATPETGQGAKENTGTLLGAITGGLIGSQFGGGTGERWPRALPARPSAA